MREVVIISRKALKIMLDCTKGGILSPMHQGVIDYTEDLLQAKPDDETIMREAVGKRIAEMIKLGEIASFTINAPAERHRDGMWEWLLVPTYDSGYTITIGCVQRQSGGAIEFHS